MSTNVKRMVVSALAGLVLLLTAPGAHAVLIFYPDRTTFDAANPGLPVEDFEEGVGDFTAFDAPLDSTTSNGTFSPGDILPGVSFTDNPGPGSKGLYFAPAPFNGAAWTSKGIGQAFPYTDALDILFSPEVTAMAVDIFQNIGGGAQSANPIEVLVSVYGPGDAFLGSEPVTVDPNSFGFFGVSSPLDLITRISMNSVVQNFESIDNVAFGAAGAVPEPGTLLLLGTGLLGAAVARARRRS
jgi:hypothetical protein